MISNVALSSNKTKKTSLVSMYEFTIMKASTVDIHLHKYSCNNQKSRKPLLKYSNNNQFFCKHPTKATSANKKR